MTTQTIILLLFILGVIFVEKCSSEVHTIHSTLNPHFKSDFQNPGTLSLVLFNSSTGAVCNDGTSGGFYWRKGYGSGINKFVIHLEGGAWCTDPDSCIYRWSSSQDLMSSLTWTSSVILSEGLFSLDPLKNAWYNANFAYVGYCSSDNWSGNGSSSFVYNSKNYTLQFKGKQIIKTLIDVLYNDYNMINANEIMFSGCSAGGQGVVVNLDYVDNLLKEEFPLANENAVFRGVADAGWLQNLVPYSGDVGAEPISTQMEEGFTFWHGVVDLTCKKSNPGWEWLCYISPYAYPHISTPIFIQTEQYDTYQVTSNCCNPPFDQGESVYIKQLREAFAFSLEEIRGNSSVFSAACFHHCLTEDTSFNTIQIGGLNMATALKNWFYFPSLPSKAIDFCQGFNCSVGCPEAPY